MMASETTDLQHVQKVHLIPAVYSKKEMPREKREFVLKDMPLGPVGTMDEVAEFFEAKIGEPCFLIFHQLEGDKTLIVTKLAVGKNRRDVFGGDW